MLIAAEASIEHSTFDNVHFGLAYTYSDVRAKFEDVGRVCGEFLNTGGRRRR